MSDSRASVSGSDTAPPRWVGVASGLIGAFGIAWIMLGAAILFLGDDAAVAAKAVKAVLLASVPVASVGLILGLSGQQHRRRGSRSGTILNTLALLGAFGIILSTYMARL